MIYTNSDFEEKDLFKVATSWNTRSGTIVTNISRGLPKVASAYVMHRHLRPSGTNPSKNDLDVGPLFTYISKSNS